MGDDAAKCLCYLIAAGVGLVGLLLAIILPLSFSELEYYEIGFARRKSTGSVDTEKVWESGKHLIGPDYEFKKYEASAHFVSLSNVAVFTADKLEISLDVWFQYFLRREDLTRLHSQYDLYYENVMKTSATDALKGEAPNFSTRQFVSDRANVESTMFKAVRERLGGKCCARNCNSHIYACPTGCKSVVLCSTQDKGLFVDVIYFQLGEIHIPGGVKDRYLRALTLGEDAARELLLQDAQIVRKQTDALVRKKQNEALEISQNGTAQSSLISTTSQAQYTATIEKARSQGLNLLYAKLGITSQEVKNSFDYLRTLRGLEHVHLTIDFQQRIVGNMGSG